MLCKIMLVSYARGPRERIRTVSELRTRIEPAAPSPGVSEQLYLGDTIHFFLSAKRAGGRSPRTVDVPYAGIGADEVEAYVVYLRDGRGMADSSRKNHLAVLRSFFQTVSRRMKLPDPLADLDEVRFHQRSPKRSYLTKREADILLSAVEKQATKESKDGPPAPSVREARRRRSPRPSPPATTPPSLP